MRKEIENWIKQAEYDFDSAKDNFKIERYSVTAFLSQQAVEKMLKAGYMVKKNTIVPPATHSLVFLGKEIGLRGEFLDILKKLALHYTLARYPGITEDLPSDLYDKDTARNILNNSEKVLKWLKKKIG